jgi:hypothetical protein
VLIFYSSKYKTSMKKTIIILGLLLTLTSSCQNKKEKKMQATKTEKFKYEATGNCPVGYPVEVYRGGFETEDGGYVSLQAGTHTGIAGWGARGSGMSDGIKTVPNRLHVQWVAYAEECVYEIDTEIDYDKMVYYFKEGYQNSGAFLNYKEFEKETYTAIVVGYAPGGAVYIWLNGSGKQVEIGRYQGKKIVIPQAEIDKLDGFEKLMLQKSECARIMNNPKMVPPEVREANKNKPIPFGLWDTYRERYSWRPTFISSQQGWSMIDCGMEMFNGENESLFDQTLVKNEFSKRAIPSLINIGWRDNTGQNYSGTLWFDEKEIFDAFATIFEDNKDGEAEIELRINIPNNFVTAFLKGNGKEIGVNLKTKLEVFAADTKY